MDGFLDLSVGGRTELRIHGVSGTPPDEMLGHPHPRQVAGDGMAGFYRRWWPGGQPTGEDADVEDVRRREAYSWGGLTSGAASRALWLLLLPFMLLNVGFYMTPRPLTQDGGSRWRKASASIQRLLALTLTLALVLSVVGVAMDLVGWQCGRPGSGCIERHGWLHFLGVGWLDEPRRQLALTSLVPAMVVALLWWLGRSTWSGLEMTKIPPRRQPPASRPQDTVLLEDRRTWNGGEPVGWLRAAHVAAAFSLIGVLLLAPLARQGRPAQLLLVLHLAVVAAAAVAVLYPTLAQRKDPSKETGSATTWLVDLLPAAAAALYLVTVLAAFFVARDPLRPRTGGLPWFTGAVISMFLAQAGLLLVVLVLTVIIARSTRRQARVSPPRPWEPNPHRPGKTLSDRWGLAGLGTAALGMVGCLIGGAFGAGLTLRAAGFLGAPDAPGGRSGPGGALLVPAPYFWAAGLSLVLLAAATVAVLAVVLRWLALRKGAYERLCDERGLKPIPEGPIGAEERATRRRLKAIAGTWARAELTDAASRVVGGLLIFTALLVVGGSGAYGLLGATWLPDHASWLTTAGSFAMGLAALWLIMVGRSAYRRPGLRRTVGILWDLGTFWPRATHPLAPPCYTERVIPELLRRVGHLAPHDDDIVVLSAHSQGTVIAAALVLQLSPEDRNRVRLLTYGSPLQRLYARYFPAYFGSLALQRVGTVLTPWSILAGAPIGEGSAWPWRNLFRPSDPIGGAVFYRYPITVDDNTDVDWQLMDPAVDPSPGDSAFPRAYGHSNYFRDPAFTTALILLETTARHVEPATVEEPADRS
jgi:hypothetical protein